jgi:ABC-type multidrug transport system permease subunit
VRRHPVAQLTLAKVREFVREPEAVFWVFVFPVLLTLALGVAFRSKGPDTMSVAVESGPGAEEAARALAVAPGLRAEVVDAAAAAERLRGGKVVLVVVPGEAPVYRYDPTRPESLAARLAVDDALQRAQGRRDVREARVEEVVEKGSRYIDFLVPGLLGMNLMGTGMWGIGFSIVNARTRNLLKRLVATPMKRSHYLAGQIAGRLVFLVLEVAILVAFARVAFDVPVRGSVVSLGVVAVLGAMTFAGLGLLVASRARTIEGVSGLMNFVMLPMWILSGTFFSTARFPDAMQPLVEALPLTALNDALRAVMIDGASLGDVAGDLAIAAAWGALSFATALGIFRWR